MDEQRCWRVGEVAKATGVTVRTLHHYDQIGLLVPSGRSDSDDRLYDESDLRRLLAIGHLTSLGLSLEEVAAALDESNDPASVLAAHVETVRARLADEQRLLARLEALQDEQGEGWDAVVDAIALTERLSHPDPAPRLRAALDAPTQAPLGELVSSLKTEEVPGVRETLTWAVAQRGPEATARIVAALDDPEPRVRLQMAHVLSKLRDPEAVPALVGLLDDPAPEVAAKAAFALGQIGRGASVDALVARLGVTDEVVGDAVVSALGVLGTLAVAPLLARLTAGRGDALVRRRAVEALGETGSPEAARSLTILVDDTDPDVALAAVLALSQLSDDAGARGLATAAQRATGRAQQVARRLVQGD